MVFSDWEGGTAGLGNTSPSWHLLCTNRSGGAWGRLRPTEEVARGLGVSPVRGPEAEEHSAFISGREREKGGGEKDGE